MAASQSPTRRDFLRGLLEAGGLVLGVSLLSAAHMSIMPEVVRLCRAAGIPDMPVVVGGIIPEEDAEKLRSYGVAKVYTPKDFELNSIMFDLVALVDKNLPLAAE